ncbi:MAG TPA: hypothetical protein VEG08_02065 [Terriglobales bacterium]|nr:hypothetical protein [Terriglobales bacterium]
MKFRALLALFLLIAPACAQRISNQRPAEAPLRLDMSKLNGMQPPGMDPLCLDKGRFQDLEYNRSPEVEKIMARPKDAVPVLISLLTSTKRVRPDPVCYWYDTRVGDVAFMMLADLFTDASWQHCTVPGACWDALGSVDTDVPASTAWHNYIKQHGRAALQNHYRNLWREYKDKLVWDPTQRCFRLPTQKN